MRGSGPTVIARRIVLLVAASVLAATAVLFLVTFNGPPPRPRPVSFADIMRAFRTGADAPRDGPRLRVARVAALPATPEGFSPSMRIDLALAAMLGVQRDDVVGSYDEAAGQAQREIRGEFAIALRTAQGWTVVSTIAQPLLTQWHLVTLAAMSFAFLILLALAWRVARAITRPLSDLADAAHAVSANDRGPPVAIAGPPEVQRVADALNAMRARLAAHVAERTTMLAAIAHDLGTPLTRLAFRAEQLPEAERERAVADIAEMRTMIQTVLEFARGAAAVHAQLDLAALLRDLAADMAAAGGDVAFAGPSTLTVGGDPAALRRLFGNLVENGLRYGGSARVGLVVAQRDAVVRVEDDGPGIDPRLAGTLFDPFVRGDPSRNRATGGIGLGLAIARDIAADHGGTIAAANRAGGGACFSVVLPLA